MNVAIIAAVVKSLAMFVYKTADFLGLKNLRACGDYLRKVPAVRPAGSNTDAADDSPPSTIAPPEVSSAAGATMKAQGGSIAQASGNLAQQAPGFSSLSNTPALADKDEEMARMKAQLEGLEQGLAREVQERTREVQELRTELRVLKSAEPLVSGKPWLPFKHKAVAGPPAAKRSPTNQVAV